MGSLTGFKEYRRLEPIKDPVGLRIHHYREFEKSYDESIARQQAARCMDCGVPYCLEEVGCPLGNLIPEWNDLVYTGHWKEALDRLHSTNNFPEFTGRICPAPCETACVLGISDSPVNIRGIERTIVDRGFQEGWIRPLPPVRRTGKKVAIIGSGPAGLTSAQQLARLGHEVTVFEKMDRAGGLLRYGIPDFKLEKWLIDRRLEQMKLEGVRFLTGIHVGQDVSIHDIRKQFHAVILSTGSEEPLDIQVKGRHLKGIHFAMDFLIQQNRIVAGDPVSNRERILATGRDVLVLGGGDTGSDCVGTSNRQKAKSVRMVRRSEKPGTSPGENEVWPLYPQDQDRTPSSLEEGGFRDYGILIKEFKDNGKGHIKSAIGSRIQKKSTGQLLEIPDADFEWPVDLALISIGYRRPVQKGLLEELKSIGLLMDLRDHVAASYGPGGKRGTFTTNLPGVYACGDARRGQSLIVWAIDEGRRCASTVHQDLVTRGR